MARNSITAQTSGESYVMVNGVTYTQKEYKKMLRDKGIIKPKKKVKKQTTDIQSETMDVKYLVDGVKLLRGEILTSLNRLAEQSMLTIKQIRNALSALRKAGYITTVTTHQYTIVKICNYDSYLI